MGFVNDKPSQSLLRVQLVEFGAQLVGFRHSFGRNQHEADAVTVGSVVAHPGPAPRLFGGRVGARKGEGRSGAKSVHLLFLILNERQQWRNAKGNFLGNLRWRMSAFVQGGQLVGEALAAAGAHNDKDVASGEGGVDNGVLLIAKGGNAKRVVQ